MQRTFLLDGVTSASNAAPSPSVSIIVRCESHKTSIRSALRVPSEPQKIDAFRRLKKMLAG